MSCDLKPAYSGVGFKTFELIDVEPQEFVAKVRAGGRDARVLLIGESLEY